MSRFPQGIRFMAWRGRAGFPCRMGEVIANAGACQCHPGLGARNPKRLTEEYVRLILSSPAMTKARQQRGSISMAPEDFLHRLEFGRDWLGDKNKEIIVEGDLVIKDNDKLLEISAAAKVRGRVVIERCANLAGFFLHVERDLHLTDLPSFCSLRGTAYGARITRCGMKSIGADFETIGELGIYNCPELSKVNCRLGRLLVEGSPLLQLGPAFSCDWAVVNGAWAEGLAYGRDRRLPKPPSQIVGRGRGGEGADL